MLGNILNPALAFGALFNITDSAAAASNVTNYTDSTMPIDSLDTTMAYLAL